VTDNVRLPTGWANYPGDVRHILDDPEPKGPNYMGELMFPVTADYDPETDTTRVGFSLMAPSPAPYEGATR
jgi:hypothetical protein